MTYDPRPGDLRHVVVHGALVWTFQCPECGAVKRIDEDQLHGRRIILCMTDACRFAQTVDLADTAEGRRCLA